MDQLTMANSRCWNCHVLWKEDCHTLRRALQNEVEDQTKKEKPKNMEGTT